LTVPELRNRFYALVTDGEGRLLVLDGSLPTWETTGPVQWNDAGAVNAALHERFGIEAITLRPVFGERREDGRAVWAYELHARRHPPSGRWVDALGAAALGDPQQRRLAREVLDGGRRDDELRPPWTRPGWYDDALNWIDERLEAAGRSRTSTAEQVHTWAISSVLRVPTPAGDVYFKAVPRLFRHEPALTEALARRHPGRVTTVLAAEPDRRWMLMEDVGGTELSHVSDVQAWEEAVRAYAGLQLEWLGDVDELSALGCPDRTLDVLEGEIDETLAEPLLVELPRGLSAEEVEALPEVGARVRAECARLRTFGLPPTLEHGDLHPGNVRIRDGGPVFYDWTDGAVSVPFFTLTQFLDLGEGAPDSDRIRAAYLDPWRDIAGIEDLGAALELAEYVGLFHLATAYRRILRSTEPSQRWELGRMLPYFVRKLTASLGEAVS
jgi:hypothetical protein